MKQAIVARSDIKMGPGKLAAQVAHASLSAYEHADPEHCRRWRGDGQAKIVLKIDGESDLLAVAEQARRAGLPTAVIRDAGRTQLDPGTVTTLGIGPAPEADIDRITGELSLY